MSTVKQGDTHDITFTVSTDLTGATVRLLARRVGTTEVITLAQTVTLPRTVTHTLTGELEPGDYDAELEITQGGVVRTAPTRGFLRFTVAPQID